MMTATQVTAEDFRSAMTVGRMVTIQLIGDPQSAGFLVESSSTKRIAFRGVDPRSGILHHTFPLNVRYASIPGGIEVRYYGGGIRYLFA